MTSQTCPNCGAPVSPDDRFCSSCGYRLQTPEPNVPVEPAPEIAAAEPAGSEPSMVIPGVGRRNAWEYERDQVRGAADDDEWKMSDLGPPPPRRRRTWLWIVIGLLALLVLGCCIFLYWIGYTDSGQDWFSGIATEAAEIVEATEQAATPAS